KQLAVVLVDLTFVDLTEALRARAPKLKQNPFENYDRDRGKKLEFNSPDIHYGCELRILELTTGKPKTWLVVIPRKAREAGRGSHNVLVFFRPGFVGYKDTASIDLLAHDVLASHLRDPSPCSPFYWWGCNPS